MGLPFYSVHMFLKLDTNPSDKIAAIDESGKLITYGDIISHANTLKSVIDERPLVFILCENTVGTLANFLACMINGYVPLLISAQSEIGQLGNLISLYQPKYLMLPSTLSACFDGLEVSATWDRSILLLQNIQSEFHPQLAMLLSTSGSTGSPKLVRHSLRNLEYSAESVSTFLGVSPRDRAIASLPIHYTMGLSVITSHLYAGACVLLMTSTLTEKGFWKFIREHEATSFTGVPYSYEVLDKLRFTTMKLPHLRTICQGGGKLRKELFIKLANYCTDSGKSFFATYGQTEGTARMAYLPPELASTKTCCIGNAIPGAELSLIDESGNVIQDLEAEGELVFKGRNVTMGYATTREDLMKGDEWQGIRYTGDIARRDIDGCYYIVGRKARFLKVFGHRIGLDEVETMVRDRFGIECVCSGEDDLLVVHIEKAGIEQLVHEYIVTSINLFHRAVKVHAHEQLPRNESGKIQPQLLAHARTKDNL